MLPPAIPSGRSPRLIVLVASLAMVFITIQTLSDMSELLKSVDSPNPSDSFVQLDDLFNDYEEEDSQPFVSTLPLVALSPNRVRAVDDLFEEYSPHRVRQEFEKTERIVLKTRFVLPNDSFGLARPQWNVSELRELAHAVQDVFFNANVLLRFSLVDEELEESRGVIYRWLLFGNKDRKRKAFSSDVELFLRSTGSKVSEEQVKAALASFARPDRMIPWIFALDEEENVPVLSVYLIRFFPFHRAGVWQNNVFLRAGSCDDVNDKILFSTAGVDKQTHRVCQGWGMKTGILSFGETSRALAHHIGRVLGLKKRPVGECVFGEATDNALMCPARIKDVQSDDSLRIQLNVQEMHIVREGALKILNVGNPVAII